MYPVPFEYHRAGSVDEAVALLGRFGESARLLAGGHSLLPLMKLRLAEPRHLVDIRRIPGLSGVREDGVALIVGAATPHQVLERSPLVRERIPMLSEAAGQIGDVQVRNMGTIGGSLAHADPGADHPALTGRAAHRGSCSPPFRRLGWRVREVPPSGLPLRGGGRCSTGHALRP